MKFFEDLAAVLTTLESRGTDTLLMDMSIQTKKALYERLRVQAARIEKAKGDL